MTAVALLDAEGRATARALVDERIASQEIKPHLIHETVVAELASRRAGTHATRTRAEVRGGGRKPWRQKGTGRARHGSIRAPQWTGGGVVFGPQPRSYGGKVNRKVRAQAFRSALRAHAERGTVALMDALEWDVPSTRRAAAYLGTAPEALAARPLLVVVEDLGGAVARSFRNLADVYVLEAGELETVDVMAGRSLLVERSAWERIAGALGKTTPVEASPARRRTRKAAPAEGPEAEAAEAVEGASAPAEEAPARRRRTRAAAPADEAGAGTGAEEEEAGAAGGRAAEAAAEGEEAE